MTFDNVKKRIINKIKTKFSKPMTAVSYQYRDMIIADISQILNEAIEINEIKSFERIRVILSDNNNKINITGTVWPFFGGKIDLNIDI